MTDEDAMIAAVAAEPQLDTPRTVLADWLDDHDQPERAAVVRLHWPRKRAERRLRADFLAEREGPVTAVATRLEAEGVAGLAEFARRQLAVDAYTGRHTAGYQAQIDWVYAALLANWRRWLPPAATTLTSRADREAYNQDYFSPAIRFPTRRKPPPRAFRFRQPAMTVLFAWGLPEWVRCDPEDWARAGPDLVRRFPWVEYDLVPA
jgi:uncharacterized protein (TIGR02996 family)